jgi:hypothetical protein
MSLSFSALLALVNTQISDFPRDTLAIPPKISKNSNRKKCNNNNVVTQNVGSNDFFILKNHIFSHAIFFNYIRYF